MRRAAVASGTGISLLSVLSNSELSAASPYISTYNMIMMCKNLGLVIPIEDIPSHDLEMVYEFYTRLEDIKYKKGNKTNG